MAVVTTATKNYYASLRFNWRCPCSLQEGWKGWLLKAPSNQKNSMIVWFYESTIFQMMKYGVYLVKLFCPGGAAWVVLHGAARRGVLGRQGRPVCSADAGSCLPACSAWRDESSLSTSSTADREKQRWQECDAEWVLWNTINFFEESVWLKRFGERVV